VPWPKDRKAATRQRIVDAATATFRARGPAGLSVDEVMARAGLTHGGFYAHFASKDELLRAALEQAGGQTLATLSATLESLPPDERLAAVIDTYLSREHVAHPERGCPVASVGAEVARAGGDQRRHLGQLVKRRLAWLRSVADTDTTQFDDEQLLAALSCMVGGVVLARAVGADGTNAVLEACRSFLHQGLGTKKEAARRAKGKGKRAKTGKK
jgi:TetR/AcrR family transcriptional repressor of nem operon